MKDVLHHQLVMRVLYVARVRFLRRRWLLCWGAPLAATAGYANDGTQSDRKPAGDERVNAPADDADFDEKLDDIDTPEEVIAAVDAAAERSADTVPEAKQHVAYAKALTARAEKIADEAADDKQADEKLVDQAQTLDDVVDTN